MDPESARLVRDEIANLRSSQRSIVICTHNLVEAEMLADRIAIIYRGKILHNATLSELKERVLGPVEYEVQFAEHWDASKLSPPDGVVFSENGSDKLRFQVENPAYSNPLLMQELVAQKAPVVALQEVPRSLEQVYLKAMSQAQGDIQ